MWINAFTMQVLQLDERILEEKKRTRNKKLKLVCGPQMADTSRKKIIMKAINLIKIKTY